MIYVLTMQRVKIRLDHSIVTAQVGSLVKHVIQVTKPTLHLVHDHIERGNYYIQTILIL